MTIRQAVRRKVISALVVSLLCIGITLLVLKFFPQAPWAGISVVFMIGAIAPLLYAVWLIDCPKCQGIFGQKYIFNIAFNLPSFNDGNNCPHCGLDLDGPSRGP